MKKINKVFCLSALTGALLFSFVLFGGKLSSAKIFNTDAGSKLNGSITFEGSAQQIDDTNKWYTEGHTSISGTRYYLIAESDSIAPSSGAIASLPHYQSSPKLTTTIYICSEDDFNNKNFSNFKFQSITSVEFTISQKAEFSIYDFSNGTVVNSSLSKEYEAGNKVISGISSGHYLKFVGNNWSGTGKCDITSMTINFTCGAEEEPAESFEGKFVLSNYVIQFNNDFTGSYDYYNGYGIQYFTYEKNGNSILLTKGSTIGDGFGSFNYYLFKGSDSSNTVTIVDDSTITITCYNSSGSSSTLRTFTKEV